MTSARATPFYCPYCADEDLRPVEEPHGAWECHGCARVFSVKFIGLSAQGIATQGQAASSHASQGASG